MACLAIILALALGLTIGLQKTKDSDCMTVSGVDPNKPCTFPFKYQGATYDTCTLAEYSLAWCATSVDHAGNYQGLWGNCGPNCPINDDVCSCYGCKCIPEPDWNKYGNMSGKCKSLYLKRCSCLSHCGKYRKYWPCQCNEKCIHFQNCCPDYNSIC